MCAGSSGQTLSRCFLSSERPSGECFNQCCSISQARKLGFREVRLATGCRRWRTRDVICRMPEPQDGEGCSAIHRALSRLPSHPLPAPGACGPNPHLDCGVYQGERGVCSIHYVQLKQAEAFTVCLGGDFSEIRKGNIM